LRTLIIAFYVIVFWGVLPGLLAGASWWLDTWLAWHFTPSPALRVLGLAIAVGAGGLLLLAMRQYARWARELPISAFPSAEFVQVGLYGTWRHPIYLFYSLCAAGLGLAAGSGSFLAIVLPCFLVAEIVYIVVEERGLARRFGPAVQGYRQRTALVVPRLVRLLRPLAWLAAHALCRFEVHHAERIPRSGPLVVIAAHRCYLDPAFLSLALPHPIRFVTTFEMFRKRFGAWLFRRLFCVPRRRYQMDLGAWSAVRTSIRQGWVIGLFLEGERSWDGSLQPLKPGAVKMLQRLGDVPVLPVRIEGNAFLWPRWRDFPRRAKVRVVIEPPLILEDGVPIDALCSKLTDLIRPNDAGLHCSAADRASGIGRVLYRCPACRGRLPLLVDAREGFSCPDCHTAFHLTPEHRVRFARDGHAVDAPLAEICRSTRLSDGDLPQSGSARSDPNVDPCEGLARCAQDVTWYEERGTNLVCRGRCSLQVTGSELIVAGKGAREVIALGDISSVTTERNRDLQVYLAREERLLQLRFGADSALYWQDLVLLSVARVVGRVPNRS